MAKPPLRLYPFGGVGEFGKNMMVYAFGRDAVMIDCGIGFPEPGQHGVDVVIPDISALRELDLTLHAIILTHGHEDHIGALPYLLPELDVPVYGTEITLGLVAGKLDEVKGYRPDLRRLPEGEWVKVGGPFAAEGVAVTHSIMDAVSIALRTPHGIVVHTGDFKFDPSPIDGRATALHRFSSLGDEGVVLLASDSTNATRAGSTMPERSVGPALRQAIRDCSGKVVVTTFASNMFRIQQIIDAAVDTKRKVVVAGRSLERNIEIARDLNRLSIPAGQLITVKQAAKHEPHQVLIIATGSQGETRAALARIAQDRFTGIRLKTGDLVVFSSSAIPGNERMISTLFNHIYRRGARVLHAGQAPLHVSGHAPAHELTTMMRLTRPRHFYPVHGEYRYLVEHQRLALATGIPEERTVIAENGQSVKLDGKGIRRGENFHAGAVFVDGELRGEVDSLVLRDRRQLAAEGIVTVTVLISRVEGRVLGEPELQARGVLHDEVGADILGRAAAELLDHLEREGQEFLSDDEGAREEVRVWLRRWFKRHIGRRPMVLPIVLEV